MRVLFVTDSGYPFSATALSNWEAELIAGLNDYSFSVMALTNTILEEPVFVCPQHVEGLLHLDGVDTGRKLREEDKALARTSLESLLGFLEGDTMSFARGLHELALLGHDCTLLELFDERAFWRKLGARLRRQLPYTPSLAELGLSANWLKTLAPLLFIPPDSDLVHVNSAGLASVPAWLGSSIHGAPLIVAEQTSYLREHYLSETETLASLKYVKSSFFKTLSQLVYYYADKVVAATPSARKWQLELRTPTEKTRVLSPGVSKRFSPTEATSSAAPYAAWLGRIDPLENLTTLVEAFSKVQKLLPGTRLLLYGALPEKHKGYFQALSDRIDTLGLIKLVHFMGPVSKPSVLDAAGLAVFPGENARFPFELVEAMMKGKAVIAADIGSAADIAADAAALFPLKDETALTAKLLELLGNPSLRRARGKRARKLALKRYQLETAISRFRQVYREVIMPASVSQEDAVYLVTDRVSAVTEDTLLLDGAS